MSNLSRVIARSTLLQKGTFSQTWLQPVSCMATMKSVSPAEHKILKENFWDKNERLKRPQSPHLTIYKLPMTANLSMTHRFTGIAMSGMMIGAGVGTLFLPMPFPEALALVQNMHFGAPIIFGAKLCITWPLSFHLLNGVRHLTWDLGYGFDMSTIHKTGWSIVVLSLIGSVVLASL